MNDVCCCLDVDGFGREIACEIRRARKEHTCCECLQTIKPGDQYEHYRGVYDDDIFTAKTCLPCAGIRRDFFHCGWYYGQMREDFYECNGWDYLGEWPERER